MEFGRLTALSYEIREVGVSKNRQAFWFCRCDCGQSISVRGAALRNGNTKSCGCLRGESASKRWKGVKKSPESTQKRILKMKGRKLSPEHAEKVRLGHIGKPRSEATKEKLRLIMRGHPILIEKSMGNKHRLGIPHTEETRRHLSRVLRGANGPNWQGGLTARHDELRKSVDFKLWREAVFERDNYTCQDCGKKQKIQPHHLLSFSKYPEKRFEVSNGVTLCISCHGKRHCMIMNERKRKKAVNA